MPLFCTFSQEENDDNYEEEPEAADEFDSDFDEDVSNCAVILSSYLYLML